MSSNKKITIGCVEFCSLESLGIFNLEVVIDNLAHTSSLLADNIKKHVINGVKLVQFDVYPDKHNVGRVISCHAKVLDVRNIETVDANTQEQYVIKTPIKIGALEWEIEINLVDRSNKKYNMVLGKEQLADHFKVDVNESFLL